ncbi:MAG: ABC transporter ATP-binding protein [Anaerolineales bacterium]|nr:ABC transporter ATP-binding protein [Anaerolineales bacterium]
MVRLARYVKPYLPLVLITIFLLFAQANFDLALPDYLSKIVNTGIQQGGVDTALPKAIRQTEFDRILIFLSAEDKARAREAYVLVEPGTPEADPYLADYPALTDRAAYIFKPVDQAAVDALSPGFAKAWLAVSGIEEALADPEKAAALSGGVQGFDLSKVPAGMDVFALLGQMPAANLQQITDATNEKFSALGDKLVVQSAARLVKAEYQVLGVDTARVQNDYIVGMGGWMLGLTLLSAACTIAVGYLSALTAAGMARDIRRDVFKKVEGFSNAEFDSFSTASLITRSTNDVTQIQMVVVMTMRMVFYAPLMGIGGVIRVMERDSSMWWLIAVAVLVLVSLIATVFVVALPKFRMTQTLIDRLNLVARENLAGMLVVRAFAMEPFEEKRFDKANLDLTAVSLFVNRVMVIMMPLMMLIMNGLSLAVIWVGAHQVAEANMQVGDMMAFLQYAMQIVMSFLMLSMMFIILPRASVSADRIADVLAVEPAIRDPQKPERFLKVFAGLVEFRNVSFRYPEADEDVLHDINFTAHPGQTTALIGATGAGKSTVVNLIPRFYDVTAGAILVDGIDIREVTQHDLRDMIGYVPQKSVLFSGTIESNLRYADAGASGEKLALATQIAQATEFVESNPEGMAAAIAQGGQNVSGGQKQRLSIARALVKQPPIYIFDDSFSALDLKTDAALRRALHEHTQNSTLLIVTQRVSTIMNAEQILVLDEGRIVGRGTHPELLNSCEIYREIALSQLAQEALA